MRPSTDYDRLSDLGEQQAAILAAEVVGRGAQVAKILAGSMRRQQQTAGAMARLVGLHVETDARLDEFNADDILARYSSSEVRLDHGRDAPPVTAEAFQDIMDCALDRWITAGEDSTAAESWPAFAARSVAAVQAAATALPSGTTAVLHTSGGVIAAACIRLMGLPEQSFLGFDRVLVNAGLTKISAGRRGLTVLTFNDHGHLERPDRSLATYR